MDHIAAERKLLFAKKGGKSKSELSVMVGIPYIVPQENVSFKVDAETSACVVEIVGLSEPFREVTYGADLLQALQLSADVDPLLKRLSKEYDFYFLTGEPYFE